MLVFKYPRIKEMLRENKLKEKKIVIFYYKENESHVLKRM